MASLTPSPDIFYGPLWRTAWRRMRRRPFQYVLFVLGVALGVAMMVSVDLASGSASRAFALSTDAIAGRTTHRLVGGPAGIDQALYTSLRVDQAVRPAAPIVEGYVQVPELDGQPLRLLGIDPFAEPPFRSYFTTTGSAENPLGGLVPFLTQPDAVILSTDLAAAYGLGLGDSLSAIFNGRATTLRVVGLLEPADAVARDALNSILFADVSTAQTVLEMDGRLSRIDLIVEDPARLAAIEALLPGDVRLETASAGSNTIQQMTAAFETNLMALSLLALVVGMFLIYNTVTFSVVQRRKLFGVLRCLGVTSRQLFWLIMVEAAILSLIGALLGLVLGVILGQGMVGLVTQTINDLYYVVTVRSVAVSGWSLLRGLVIGIGAALLAALLPALEAMRTTPNAGLRRSTIEGKAARIVPWLLLVWLLLTLAGTALLAMPWGGLVTSFGGLFAILIGAALLSPPVTVIAMRGLTPLMSRAFGAIGRMATRDIVRSLSRTSIAIAALMTAVSVIVGVSIMIGSFRGTVTRWLDDTLQADIYVSPPSLSASRVDGTLAPEIIDTILGWPDIAGAVAARQVEVQSPTLNRPVELNAVDGDISRGQRQFLWLDGSYDDVWERFLAGEGVMVTEPLFRKEGWSTPPPAITLLTDQGPQSFPVLGVSYDYSSDRGAVVIGMARYRALWDDPGTTSLAVFTTPGGDAVTIIAALQTALSGRTDVILQSNQGLRATALEIFDRTFAITAALQLLAVVVAFIGVLSALMSLQLERASELGVLRATGMTLGQLWRLTLLETGLMGAVAGLLALPTGYVLAWILVYVINVRSFGWTLQMTLSPSSFLQALAVAVIAALLAGIYPSLRLGQMTIATAVRQD